MSVLAVRLAELGLDLERARMRYAEEVEAGDPDAIKQWGRVLHEVRHDYREARVAFNAEQEAIASGTSGDATVDVAPVETGAKVYPPSGVVAEEE